MTGDGSGAGVPPPRRGPPVVLLLPVVLACVVVPYLFWQGTWFGKPLSDDEIVARLAAVRPEALPAGSSHPLAQVRRAQHALEQISRRIQARDTKDPRRGPADPARFYPYVVALAGHPEPLLRSSVAWLMQWDAAEPRFRAPLAKLIADPEPTVRRNAALALWQRGDAAALPVLRAMLRPYDVRAPRAGEVVAMVGARRRLRASNEVARIDTGTGILVVRAPLEGRVTGVRVVAGARVESGAPLCSLEPTTQEVRYALVGLARLGGPQDLPLVEPYLGTQDGYGSRVREIAKRTQALLAQRAKR